MILNKIQEDKIRLDMLNIRFFLNLISFFKFIELKIEFKLKT